MVGINERLKFNRPFAWLGNCIVLVSVILIIMTFMALLYLSVIQTTNNTIFAFLNSFYYKTEHIIRSAIESTYFFPFGETWNFVFSHTMFGYEELGKVKIILLCAAGVVLGNKLAEGYRRAKRDSKELDKKVQQELDLEQRRREKGLSSDSTPLQSVKVSITQKHETASRKRFWDEKWWGKLFLMIAGAVILKLLHLK